MIAPPLDRFAVLSDIHGNLLALEAVLSNIASEGITQTVCRQAWPSEMGVEK